MIVLELGAGPNEGQRIALERTLVRIGGLGCHVVIVDPKVSNPHCEIELKDGRYLLVDLGSKHGTRLGSRKAAPLEPNTPVEIEPGAVIWLGDSSIELSELRADKTAKIEPGIRPRAAVTPDPMVKRRVPLTRDDTERFIPGGQTLVMAPPISADARVFEALGDDDEPPELHARSARLSFTSGPHAGRQVFLGQAAVTFGRSDENVVVLSDPQAELRHAEVVHRDDAYWIDALGNRAVVRVNGERVIDPRALKNGDIFAIGASDVTFFEGGVDMEAPNAAATIVMQDALFAYSGQVRRQRTLTIGRSPDSDLFLDHHSVDRAHALIAYRYPDFYLQDLSAEGTYIRGERVAEKKLVSGDDARIGDVHIRFDIQPLRCSLDVVAPADDGVIPRFSPDVDAAAAYQTLYHLPTQFADDGPKKIQKNRATVLWVEPFDVKRTWRTAIMVGVATIMSVVVVALLAGQGGSSFLRRPLSEGHRSPEFTQKLAGNDSCASCHGKFEGRVSNACTSCHPKAQHPLRAKHASVERCTQCHAEHLTERGGPKLIDGALCAASGCHVTPHLAFFPQTPGPAVQTPTAARALERRAVFGVDLLADVAFERSKRKTQIHQIHLGAGLKKQCGACHESAGEERAVGAAYQSCYTCHGPKKAEEAMNSPKCSECHREHGDDAVWATAQAKAGALTARGTGQVAFLLLLLPVALVFGFHHVAISRRKFLTHVADEEKKRADAAEEMLCEGVTLAEAKKVPRLTPSKCVGAADCVVACPYQVLEMAPGKPPKPIVARPELCHECGLCIRACGPGALTMMEPGEPFPLVDRPAVDANYEASIPGSNGGVYVIGAAAAKPSVKNGINLGYWSVTHAAFEGAHPGAAAQLGLEYELVIIGGGPAGLSAALTAQEKNLEYVVLERAETFAGAVRAYPVGKLVQVNPPHPEDPAHPELDEVAQVGNLWLERDASKEDLLERWRPIAAKLNISYDARVDGLRADRGGFVVTAGAKNYRALKVIIAAGDRGDPRRLGVPGDGLEKVHYALEDATRHAGQHAMVVGGGNSAIEAAIALGKIGGCASVIIVYRGKSFTRATQKNRKSLEELIATGKVIAQFGANPVAVKPSSVSLDGDQGDVPNDVLFTLLGSDPPTAWLKQLGIEITKKSADWEPGPTDKPAFLKLGGGP